MTQDTALCPTGEGRFFGFWRWQPHSRAPLKHRPSTSGNEKRFAVELSNDNFAYNPSNNVVSVEKPDGAIEQSCEMTVTWLGAPLAASSTKAASEILEGTTNATTAAAAKTYTGFGTGTITQATIKADGSTIVRIKQRCPLCKRTHRRNKCVG